MLSDTHLRTGSPGRSGSERQLPPLAWRYVGRADVVLHAGDILDEGVLAMLGESAPVKAVLGNNDRSLVGHLPGTLQLELAGVRIGMVHDSGPRPGRAQRLRRRFPEADLVVFGHSHVPVAEAGTDGQLLFNPGSPTQKRSQPVHTMGWLVLEDGRVAERSIVPLDAP